jgi:hypothetical protein
VPRSRRLAKLLTGPSFAGRSIPHFLLSVLFLGLVTYLLKGRELNFSLWGGLAMAFVYGAIAVILEAILHRQR